MFFCLFLYVSSWAFLKLYTNVKAVKTHINTRRPRLDGIEGPTVYMNKKCVFV